MIWSALSNTRLLRREKKTTLDDPQFIGGLAEVTHCSGAQRNKAVGFLWWGEELRASLKSNLCFMRTHSKGLNCSLFAQS